MPCGDPLTLNGELGRPVRIDRSTLAPGPYPIAATAFMPSGRTLTGEGLHYEGTSPIQVLHCSSAEEPVEMLDAAFEAVPEGIGQEESGSPRVLRHDLSGFQLRLLVELPGLGRRQYLADNGGDGFTFLGNSPREIFLEYEVVRTAWAKLAETLASGPGLPRWVRRDIRKRLKAARLTKEMRSNEPEAVAACRRALAVLSTAKASLPGASGVALWCAPGVEKVAHDEPVPAIRQRAARVGLARNEYEPIQIVLRPDQALAELSVVFEPFRGPSGAVLADENLAVNGVHYVDIVEPTDAFGLEGPWPDALPKLADQPEAPAGVNTPLWITAYAPADQPAGLYKGAAVIREGGAQVARVPLEIEVFDFTLPEETHTETAYGVSVNGRYHGPLSPEQRREVHDRYMQVCAEHRISPYSPHALDAIAIGFEGEPRKPVIDYTRFDAAMSRYLDEFKLTTFKHGPIAGPT